MKVREIMTKDLVSVKPDDTAQDALLALFKMQISGLPVIDAQGKLVGMFTEKGVLSYILPSYLDKVGRFIYEENPKSTKIKCAQLSGVKVSELMRKEVVTTTEEVTLCEAARIMLTQKVRRLPVLNTSGEVVGIVARCDIVRAMVQEAGINPAS